MNAEFKRMQELAGLTEINVEPPGVGNLLQLNINPESDEHSSHWYTNYQKLIDYLGKFVTRPDIFKSNGFNWENMLFHDYDEWIEIWEPDEEEIESAPSKEEWNKIHEEMENNYNFNYFVRNFDIGDEEESRHTNDIGEDLPYFQNKYNVSSTVAKIMKKLVDEYLASIY